MREPVSDFDARSVYFAYRPDKPQVEGWAPYWHMVAMQADGSGLRQLTDGPFHDFDAVCLPDGGVAFSRYLQPNDTVPDYPTGPPPPGPKTPVPVVPMPSPQPVMLVQLLEQVSQLTALPSSHCSVPQT